MFRGLARICYFASRQMFDGDELVLGDHNCCMEFNVCADYADSTVWKEHLFSGSRWKKRDAGIEEA